VVADLDGERCEPIEPDDKARITIDALECSGAPDSGLDDRGRASAVNVPEGS
jgi:hypothetical protein